MSYADRTPEQKHRYNQHIDARKKTQGYKAKATLLAKLGNKCVCCMEPDPVFLTVDHINGDGAEHRMRMNGRTTTSTGGYVRWPRMLADESMHPFLRVLCANCHNAFTALGLCPHQGA